MKFSGVEWIGMIPDDWSLDKISSLYLERNERISDMKFQPLSVTKNGILLQLESAAKTDNGENRKLVKINDFVINSRSCRRGSCGISMFEGSVSLINIVIFPYKKINKTYYGYVFRTKSFADEFYSWGNGIVDDLWLTKWSSMKKIYVPILDFQTQQQIADFLDKKCAAIDKIIELKKMIIEKLKEYKQSLIYETVTGKMIIAKDSL